MYVNKNVVFHTQTQIKKEFNENSILFKNMDVFDSKGKEIGKVTSISRNEKGNICLLVRKSKLSVIFEKLGWISPVRFVVSAEQIKIVKYGLIFLKVSLEQLGRKYSEEARVKSYLKSTGFKDCRKKRPLIDRQSLL